MSRSERVVVDLSARCPLVELALFGSDFEEVARGVGRLRAELPAGLYELAATAGATTTTEIIRLGGADHVVDPYDVDFATVTPATGESAADIATTLSRSVVAASGSTDAGLVIVCAVMGTGRVEVLDSAHHMLAEASDWVVTPDGGCRAWQRVRPPGLHFIRYRTDSGTEDLAVWLSSGWQSVVFIPAHGEEPSVAATVLHMTPIGVAWEPDRDRDVLLEVALDSGQRHRPPLPSDLLSVVLDHADAPSVVLATTALALQGSHLQLPALVELLRDRLPDSPDVQALSLVGTHGDSTPSVSQSLTYAAMFHRALLAADHAGRHAIAIGSPLHRAVPGVASNGPYVTQLPEPVTIRDWVAAHVPARSHPRAAEHPLAALARQSDATTFAKATGLTKDLAQEVVTLVTARGDHSWIDLLKDLGNRLGPDAKVLRVPGHTAWSLDSLHVRVRCDWRLNGSEILLSAASDILPKSFPMLVSGPDDVSWLLTVVNGRAAWRSDSAGPFTLRWPEAERLGELSAYEAVSIEPERVPSFSSRPALVHERTLVPGGRFRMDTYEDDERNLELSVLSDLEQDVGACALVVLRKADRTHENLVVPLSWLGSHKVACGALRVGRADEVAKVLVVPDLQRPTDLDLEAVRRSLNRSADAATEQALRQVEARLIAAGR